MSATLLLALVSVVVFVVETVRRYRQEKASGVPGPISNWIPFFGPLYRTLLLIKHRERLLDLMVDEAAQFGPMWSFQGLVGPRIVCVSDPTNMEYMLNEPDVFIKGQRFQQYMRELLGHGIFNVNGSQWLIQRRLASHMFTRRALREMVAVFDRHCAHLLEHFDAAKRDGQPLLVQDSFMRFTLDSFSEISGMGSANSLTSPQRFSLAFDVAQLAVTERFTNPAYGLLAPLGLAGVLQSEQVLGPAIDTINAYATDIIAKKRSQLSLVATSESASSDNDSDDNDDNQTGYVTDRRDLITRYLELDPNMNTTYIRDAIQNFILAGRDTTAVCLTWTLYELARNPGVHDALAEEVRSYFGATATPAYDELATLPYMNAVINETLRLHPSVPWDPKETAVDVTMPGGEKIAQGCVVSWVAYATGRNAALWPDPLAYQPLRWIDADAYNGGVKITKYAFPAFQPGKRQCLGMQLAYTEVAFVLVRLCQRGLRFALPPDELGRYRISVTLLAASLRLRIV